MYELASGPITGLPRLVWCAVRTNYDPAADPAPPPIPTFRMFLAPAINYEPSAQRSKLHDVWITTLASIFTSPFEISFVPLSPLNCRSQCLPLQHYDLGASQG